MKWPFVSRARFEDLQQRLAEKDAKLSALREQHMRVVDEINFRSTGFHLYPQYVVKQETAPAVKPAADPLNDPAKEPETTSTHMRTQLRAIEHTNIRQFEENRKKESVFTSATKQKAADALEKALSEGDQLAQQA